MTDALDTDALRRRFAAVAGAVVEARQHLNALDALAGDGDLGESLVVGFAAVRDDSADGAGTIGAELRRVGTVLGRAAPSTFGTLIGMALRDAGKELVDASRLDGPAVVTMLDAIVSGVARRGEVAAGDRTVLDALVASRAAAAELVGTGVVDADAVLAAAAVGAAAGAEATASMTPRAGRAAWIGERARGAVDAGATAWAIIAANLAANRNES